jgi:hypothetical protein
VPRPAATFAAVVLALLLGGCVSGGGDALLSRIESARPPAGMDRNALLSTMAACHLLRVAQTRDESATDATVIAAVERYGYQVAAVIDRSSEMLRDGVSTAALLLARAVDACRDLAEATGVTSALVRFESDGALREVWLRIDGIEMQPGFAEQTITELRRRRAIGLVINSPGGSVYEARELGRFLRANGLRTAVDRICTSACVDVFAGGVERYVGRDAKLGIHQSRVPSRYSSHEGGQLYVAESFRYLREMGVDAEVAIAAASVPNNQILLIPLADALSTRLVTGVVQGFE